jgi:WD40 repeat protein
VSLWDPATGQHLRSLEPGDVGTKISAMAFSPDSRLLAAGTEHDGTWLWNPATGKLKQILEAGDSGSRGSALAFSPSGHLLAIGEGKTLQLWRQ